jgi:hypothetical protein
MATNTTVTKEESQIHTLAQVEAKEQEVRNAFGKIMLECKLDWEDADKFLRHSVKDVKRFSLEKRWEGACRLLARLQKS